ncbi:MAG: phage tail family protein [Clostridia bacterium]|nr:phage tail family protein [Clostridia bacterium]
MNIIIKNIHGERVLTGDGGGNIGITKISGISNPPYEIKKYTSFDFDGAIESARRIPSRGITLAGDIKGDTKAVKEFLKILSDPFDMIVIGDDEREIRIASANCEINKIEKNISKFVISCIADDPYFYDSDETKVALFEREELVDKNLTLPSMFSKRTATAGIKVNSDRIIEPKIVITGKNTESQEDGRIVIINEKTKAEFVLLYTPEENEIITVDVKQRQITSDKNGNIISSMTLDSFMSDLEIGTEGATFSLVGYGKASNISAYIIYKNCYLEAIA